MKRAEDGEMQARHSWAQVGREALDETDFTRTFAAHRLNDPEQQCCSPVLHSKSERNTLTGPNFLELLNIKKPMVPRGKLSHTHLKSRENNDLKPPNFRSAYYSDVLISMACRSRVVTWRNARAS